MLHCSDEVLNRMVQDCRSFAPGTWAGAVSNSVWVDEEMFLISPFPSSFMLGSYDDDDGAQLYMIDPSGVSYVSLYKNTSILG